MDDLRARFNALNAPLSTRTRNGTESTLPSTPSISTNKTKASSKKSNKTKNSVSTEEMMKALVETESYKQKISKKNRLQPKSNVQPKHDIISPTSPEGTIEAMQSDPRFSEILQTTKQKLRHVGNTAEAKTEAKDDDTKSERSRDFNDFVTRFEAKYGTRSRWVDREITPQEYDGLDDLVKKYGMPYNKAKDKEEFRAIYEKVKATRKRIKGKGS
jgi:hypothetical protein